MKCSPKLVGIVPKNDGTEERKQRCLSQVVCFINLGFSREVLSGLLEEPSDFILYSARMYPDIYKNVSRHIDEATTTSFAGYQI